METTPEKDTPQDSHPYVPRPAWQVWAARAGLVLFLILVVIQLLSIARGGL